MAHTGPPPGSPVPSGQLLVGICAITFTAETDDRAQIYAVVGRSLVVN